MKIIKFAYLLMIIVIFVLCYYAIKLYPQFIGDSISHDSKDWSEFGSYIGGTVGPLLSLLAFIGVLLSIANQNSENRRSEIANKLQSTEDRIIKHIEFHHNICDNVKVVSSTITREGRIAFEFLYENHLKSFFQDVENQNSQWTEEQKTEEAFSKLYVKYGKHFGFYFRNLFYLIKYIDDTTMPDKDKIHYAKLVRAQLSTPEIQLLMYNCLFQKGKGFKELVTKYGLLNGIDDTEVIKPIHKTDLFDPKAFL